MGLDMYIQNAQGDEYVYWRKANAINGWFDAVLDGVENVTPYEVNKEILQALVDDCKYVLSLLEKGDKIYTQEGTQDFYIYDHLPSEVYETLPPMIGFFFGNYEIDELYEYKLKSTIEQIEPLIEFHDFEAEPLYYYIWF